MKGILEIVMDEMGVDANHTFIKRLKEIIPDEARLADVLEVINTTCRYCWDTNTKTDTCYCTARCVHRSHGN